LSKPELLKFALERRIKSLGITRKLDAGRVLAAWTEAVGAQVASRAAAESFEAGVLTVVVPDSTWRQELSLTRQDMIERLNQVLESHVVKDLYLVATPRTKGA
jgi:predicted nucleic acid-binding Zn ribbon protein